MANAKFKECRFVAGIRSIQQIPSSLIVNEVAFAGRANVGKSSLLNALTHKKDLARTSKTPGRTQQINFFAIENFITLVDLPGYGYSKVSKTKIDAWSRLIANYVSSRQNLQQVFLLIDARHGFKNNDLAVIEWLDSYQIPYRIVLTKADKIDQIELKDVQTAMQKVCEKEILVTSSVNKIGLDKLRFAISSYSGK